MTAYNMIHPCRKWGDIQNIHEVTESKRKEKILVNENFLGAFNPIEWIK